MTYESGFRWVDKPPPEPGWNLVAPSGKVAATVFSFENYTRGGGHAWFVWDDNGTGGENSIEPTVEQAKITAESAVLRWGKHFKTRPALASAASTRHEER